MFFNLTQDLKREFNGYNAKKFQQDLLAGFTVTAVALPLALAFGVGSVGSASSGLITAILAGILVGGLSGGSFQISGPTGAMTAILIVVFQNYGIQGVWTAGVISGILLVLCGVLKFGRIVSFIPTPVVTGFTSGIAAVIAVGQIDNFLGVKTAAENSSAIKLVNYFTNPVHPNWQAVLLALIVMAVMLVWPKKWSRFIPSSLAGLAVSLAVSTAGHFNVAMIGEIPKTLISSQHFDLFTLNWQTAYGMIMPAISIAALCMIESLLCGEVGGKMRGEKMDVNRELVSQGIGNFVIPFFGGVPVTAAIARTSVGIKSGGQTRLVSIVHSVGLLLSMFVLAPVMSKIPLSSLAGVLMITAWRMNEWKNIKYFFRPGFKTAIIKFLATLIATVALDLTQAILIGMVISSLLFMLQITSSMEITMQTVDEKSLEKKLNLSFPKHLEYVRIAYLTGPIFFATVEQLNSQLKTLVDVRILILSMRGVPTIDTSGIIALENMEKELKERGCQIMFCGVQPAVTKRLKYAGVIKDCDDERLFWSAEQAILRASEL